MSPYGRGRELDLITVTRKFSVQVTAETAEQKRASHPQSRRSREPGKTQQTQRIIPCDRKLRAARDETYFTTRLHVISGVRVLVPWV